MPYQNYHKHCHISNIIVPDSVVLNEDYCKRAVELGHSIISSCEHGTQGDYRECATLAEIYGLKWRYVTEAYFVLDRLAPVGDDGKLDSTNAHMILAAKTEKGIGDLNELLSEANLTGYYGRPRIDLQPMCLSPRLALEESSNTVFMRLKRLSEQLRAGSTARSCLKSSTITLKNRGK